jgi:hypothetical protein
LGLLRSLEQLDQTAVQILVFDLGLTRTERETLDESHPRCQLRQLDWSRYPTHVADISVFAWKPLIIQTVLHTNQYKVVFWLDAGCILTDADSFSRFLAGGPVDKEADLGGSSSGLLDGALLTLSNAKVGQLTHESMLHRLQGLGMSDKWQANGGVVGFVRNSRAISYLLDPWVACALDVSCIAPPGSNRSNHRQDQAALSILAHRFGFALKHLSNIGIEVHRDVDVELVIVSGLGMKLGGMPGFDVIFEVECLGGVHEKECCSKGLVLVYINHQDPVSVGGKAVPVTTNTSPSQDDVAFICKSSKARQ